MLLQVAQGDSLETAYCSSGEQASHTGLPAQPLRGSFLTTQTPVLMSGSTWLLLAPVPICSPSRTPVIIVEHISQASFEDILFSAMLLGLQNTHNRTLAF